MTLPRWLEIALMIPGAFVYLGLLVYGALMLVCSMKPKPPTVALVLLLVAIAIVLRIAWNERNQSYQKSVDRMMEEVSRTPKVELPREWPKINQGMEWGGNPTNSEVCK